MLNLFSSGQSPGCVCDSCFLLQSEDITSSEEKISHTFDPETSKCKAEFLPDTIKHFGHKCLLQVENTLSHLYSSSKTITSFNTLIDIALDEANFTICDSPFCSNKKIQGFCYHCSKCGYVNVFLVFLLLKFFFLISPHSIKFFVN